jgi:hypothetical protein
MRADVNRRHASFHFRYAPNTDRNFNALASDVVGQQATLILLVGRQQE